MKFIGIDLAWKIEKFPKEDRCSVAVIDSDLQLLGNKLMRYDKEIIEYVSEWVCGEEGVVIGIDAPLIIPENVVAKRKCEKYLQKADIQVYPANRARFLKEFNGIRGEEITNKIQSTIKDIKFVDKIKLKTKIRAIIEIYPYSALKVLLWEDKNLASLSSEMFCRDFNKIKVPKYKKGSKSERIIGLNLIANLLERLGLHADENLVNNFALENFNIIKPELNSNYTITQLDQTADYFDAVIAAYTVWRYWFYGLGKSMVVGDEENGYILIPVDIYVRERLMCIMSDRLY